LLEQSIRLRTMGEEHLPLTGAEKDFALRLNKLCDISQQQAITEQLDDAAYHIERNANAKMLFMALTIKLYHIIANHSVIEVGYCTTVSFAFNSLFLMELTCGKGFEARKVKK